MYKFLAMRKLREQAQNLRDQFQSADPFQHVCFEDLVQPHRLEEVLAAFPNEDWENWRTYPNEHAQKTKVCESTYVLPSPISRLIFELNSGPFLELLEKISGIDNLLPDPHLRGGGMHMTVPGGTLTPHTDHHLFDKHPRYRRLNLILYLNENWEPSNQGFFELWDRNCTRVEKEISPLLGNSLLFRTDDNSVHGFSMPVKGDFRRSIAVFYYTATANLEEYGGNTATYWQAKTLHSRTLNESVRLGLQGILWATGRVFGRLSWYCQKLAARLSAMSTRDTP